jgi:hypothetical protein
MDVVPTMPASEFGRLAPADRAEILAGIAEESFTILLRVPGVGLRDSAPALGQLIEARRWLEGTRDVQAWTLLLYVQYGLDSAVINELWRAEQTRVGEAPRVPFVAHSLDRPLCMDLLRKNRLDELRVIEFALSLDTPVGELARREGLGPAAFLDGTAFAQYGEKLVVGPIRTRMRRPHGGPEEEFEFIGEDKRLDAIEPLGILLFARAIDSREKLAKMFLPIALGGIQDARDVRLLADLYWEKGGFSEAGERGQPRHISSKSIQSRLKELAASESAKRLVRRDRSNVLIASNLKSQLRKRADVYEDFHSYLSALAVRFRLFMRNLELIPEEDWREAIRHGGIGLWLDLRER